MAEPLKNAFDARVVQRIAQELGEAWPEFPKRRFLRAATLGLESMELTARGQHVAAALAQALPQSFEAAAEVVLRSFGPALDDTEGNGMSPFRYLPHAYWVARHGLGHFEAAMAVQHALTQRFTAEFSIRPFLEAEPERTLAQLHVWVTDPSVHVRRLVSEGTRTLLPWASRLEQFRRDPEPVLALLERLKDDPERYVQRSVANNLNDLSKDHPERIVALCRRWRRGAGPGRRYIIGHGLRTLVKRGDPAALEVLGYGEPPQVALRSPKWAPKVVPIGQVLRFQVTLLSKSARPQVLLVDYRVHFQKARGHTQPKVFKLKQLTLAAGGQVELRGSVSFKVHTTRRPHPGRHTLELLINGVVHPLGEFQVRRPR